MDFKRGIIRIFFGFILLLLLIPIGSEAGVSVTGGLTHERIIEIGETYQGTVLVENNSDEPQEVKIYQTDYLFFYNGRYIYGEPGKDVRSNADWISFSPARLIIPPQETAAINYTIRVPENKSLLGTYWSMIMVEGIGKDSPEASTAPEEDKTKISLRQVMRYGIQIITHIGDSGIRNLKILDQKFIKEKENYLFQLDIENVGERWLRPQVWAELYNQKGSFIGKFSGGVLRIYPGTSVRYRIGLNDIPSGKYKVLLVIDNGDEYIWGLQYNLEF